MPGIRWSTRWTWKSHQHPRFDSAGDRWGWRRPHHPRFAAQRRVTSPLREVLVRQRHVRPGLGCEAGRGGWRVPATCVTMERPSWFDYPDDVRCLPRNSAPEEQLMTNPATSTITEATLALITRFEGGFNTRDGATRSVERLELTTFSRCSPISSLGTVRPSICARTTGQSSRRNWCGDRGWHDGYRFNMTDDTHCVFSGAIPSPPSPSALDATRGRRRSEPYGSRSTRTSPATRSMSTTSLPRETGAHAVGRCAGLRRTGAKAPRAAWTSLRYGTARSPRS